MDQRKEGSVLYLRRLVQFHRLLRPSSAGREFAVKPCGAISEIMDALSPTIFTL